MIDVLLAYVIVFAIASLTIALLSKNFEDTSLKLLLALTSLITISFNLFGLAYLLNPSNLKIIQSTNPITNNTETYIYIANQNEFVALLLKYNYVLGAVIFFIIVIVALKMLGISLIEIFKKTKMSEKYEKKYSE